MKSAMQQSDDFLSTLLQLVGADTDLKEWGPSFVTSSAHS